jgi:DNA-binding LacI/PurR family transcriptional regulator
VRTTTTLPFLDLDYHAIARHAAGKFLSLGHRRIAWLLSQPARSGDLATQKGFEEAADTYKKQSGTLFAFEALQPLGVSIPHHHLPEE